MQRPFPWLWRSSSSHPPLRVRLLLLTYLGENSTSIPGRCDWYIRRGQVKDRMSNVRGSPTVVLGVLQSMCLKNWFFFFLKSEGTVVMNGGLVWPLPPSPHLHLWNSRFMAFLSRRVVAWTFLSFFCTNLTGWNDSDTVLLTYILLYPSSLHIYWYLLLQ